MSGLPRDIVLIPRDLGRQNKFAVRVRFEICLWSHQRNVWSHESHCQKEGLFHILGFADEFDGLLRRFAVRVNQIIAIGLDGIEALAGDSAFLQTTWSF